MDNLNNSQNQTETTKPIKTIQPNSVYEKTPLFIKAGLVYSLKYENVRKQGFRQRYVVCDHLKAKGNNYFNENKIQEATQQYEQVLF